MRYQDETKIVEFLKKEDGYPSNTVLQRTVIEKSFTCNKAYVNKLRKEGYTVTMRRSATAFDATLTTRNPRTFDAGDFEQTIRIQGWVTGNASHICDRYEMVVKG